jgi:hypothetical protein
VTFNFLATRLRATLRGLLGGAGRLALQGFVSNSTPLNCNAENLVGIDCFLLPFLKSVAIRVVNTTVLKVLQSFVAFG